MLNLERKASKVIIENQEGRIEPLESLVKEYESQIKELQEKCRTLGHKLHKGEFCKETSLVDLTYFKLNSLVNLYWSL